MSEPTNDVDVDRDAPVIVDLTTTITAPPEVVWRHHTDVNAWPSWQTDISRASLTGAVEPGSSFEWETHGLQITSTIAQVVPGRRIVWGGPAMGIDGVHVWTFTPSADGTVVHTTESWAGAPVEADRDALHTNLADSLTAWLQQLKDVSESTHHHNPKETS